MLRLEVLDYLYRVYRFNSIRLAAESIPVAPSTISSALHKLEKEWNLTLLNRTYRGIELTETAQKIAKACVPLFMEADKLDELIKEEQGLITKHSVNKLTIFLARGWWYGLSSEIFTYFQEKDIEIELPDLLYKNKDYLQIIEQNKQAVLINFFTEPVEDNFSNYKKLRFLKISSNKPCVIAAHHSKWLPKNIKEISPKEAIKLPFLRYSEGIAQALPIFDMLNKYGKVNIIEDVSNLQLLTTKIQYDKGVSVAAQNGINHPNENFWYVPIRSELKLSLLLCYNEELPEKLLKFLWRLAERLSNELTDSSL